MTRVLITGGRYFSDRKLLNDALDAIHAGDPIVLLIHGDANGADRLAGQWATSNGIAIKAIPAAWEKHGRAAGPIRNTEMLNEKPDLVVAFPGGRGTEDMVRKAKLSKVPVVSVCDP